MMEKKYPKILIIGETFRSTAGGGITMTNLFKEWPLEQLAVVTDRINETDTNLDCRYYQLGDLEMSLAFPYCLFNYVAKSGEINISEKNNNKISIDIDENIKSKIKIKLKQIYLSILLFLGIYNIYIVN